MDCPWCRERQSAEVAPGVPCALCGGTGRANLERPCPQAHVLPPERRGDRHPLWGHWFIQSIGRALGAA